MQLQVHFLHHLVELGLYFKMSVETSSSKKDGDEAMNVQLLSKCSLTTDVLLSASCVYVQRPLPMKLHAGHPSQTCFCLFT